MSKSKRHKQYLRDLAEMFSLGVSFGKKETWKEAQKALMEASDRLIAQGRREGNIEASIRLNEFYVEIIESLGNKDDEAEDEPKDDEAEDKPKNDEAEDKPKNDLDF